MTLSIATLIKTTLHVVYAEYLVFIVVLSVVLLDVAVLIGLAPVRICHLYLFVFRQTRKSVEFYQESISAASSRKATQVSLPINDPWLRL